MGISKTVLTYMYLSNKSEYILCRKKMFQDYLFWFMATVNSIVLLNFSNILISSHVYAKLLKQKRFIKIKCRFKCSQNEYVILKKNGISIVT